MIQQFALAFFGLAAMWLATGSSLRGRKWAPIVGLMGQPAWLAFAVEAKAWGVFAISLVYAALYLRRTYEQWRPEIKRVGACAHRYMRIE